MEKKWDIKAIESMDYMTALEMCEEVVTIKGHDIYFIDFPGPFGYSYVVFMGEAHIYFANSYQLHYVYKKTKEELKEWYLKSIKQKLFTEDELKEPIKTYDEYKRKAYYLQNYYPQQKPYISIWFTGDEKERKARQKKTKTMIYDPVAFSYFNDKEFVQHHLDLFQQLTEREKELQDSYDYWYEAFYRELNNYECICSDRTGEIFDALGVTWNTMNDNQKKAWKNAKHQYFKDMENYL